MDDSTELSERNRTDLKATHSTHGELATLWNDTKPFLSWISVTYVLVFCTIYVWWNITTKGWGGFFFIGGITSTSVSIIANVLFALGIVGMAQKLRQSRSPQYASKYLTINVRLMLSAFVLSATVVAFYTLLLGPFDGLSPFSPLELLIFGLLTYLPAFPLLLANQVRKHRVTTLGPFRAGH